MRVTRIRWESKYIADSSASLDSPEMFAIVPCQKPVGRSWDSKRNEEKKKHSLKSRLRKKRNDLDLIAHILKLKIF